MRCSAISSARQPGSSSTYSIYSTYNQERGTFNYQCQDTSTPRTRRDPADTDRGCSQTPVPSSARKSAPWSRTLAGMGETCAR